jgi:hypothetical protein
VEAWIDATREAGVDFVHVNGMGGELYLPEVTAGGCGVLDYDGDGDLDLYLVQGHRLPPLPREDPPLLDRLLRNDTALGPDGKPRLRFTDVTGQSGIAATGYGMGVTAADYDNDGHVDLFVTHLGANQLWRNRGDGTFEDVTSLAGLVDDRWTVPAVFFDFDRDGWLDLFVGAYVDFTFAGHKTCLSVTGAPDYCGPSAYRPLPDRLYRNRGDGTFEDVTTRAGLNRAYGPALGAVAVDLNEDGWLDLYVANDGQPNQMWINQKDGRFVDEALVAGTAVNAEGVPEAGMGVLAADFTGDGRDDLFLTHLTGETNTFYANEGGGLFRDTSIATGLGPPSRWATGFGAAAVDLDNDGWLDIMTVNGAVRTIEEQARRKEPYPLAQPNQLFLNRGGGRFEEAPAPAGSIFSVAEVSRGLALADLDGDGDGDLLLVNSNGPARLLRNQVGQERGWLGVRALTADRRRDALGARIGLFREGRPPLWRRVAVDGSYASSNDPRVLFGLGRDTIVERLQVHWPSGRVESFDGAAAGRYVTLVEGTGREGP